ncbi:uncharacterized protein RHOBADRAFT_45335 [Rhodotorula graminis WP1]|uniref:Proteophosphoglycan ppg4 n=1 Tax=Rhodotorula graminis (strain WP1) TaxID=578459 RepID=A0A0P9H1Z8_RHOGW|nr:uncharacterized protein RHOBADRAFT_45335 [Rhodotorula graminis WP1]KPV74038.1 hypothetical protein RHOBADRAFT_45335 [Rhodotorula graminis WP1]
MSAMLPPALDAQTVPRFLAALDAFAYPKPAAGGFTARVAILAALTSLSMVLSVVYLGLHCQSTLERPRRRCLWLVRFLERPSGRFLAINTRPSWTVSIFLYSAFQLACVFAYWRAYGCHESLKAWIILRAFIGVFMFAAAWVISWSGLMAFLLAVEPEKVYMSARAANVLFVGGGALLFSVNLVTAIVTASYGVRTFDRYLDLRQALIALEASLAGRAPTFLDLLPLQAPLNALKTAENAARIANALQWSFVAVLPLFILAVDLGGLLLCARMRRQIRESVEGREASAVERAQARKVLIFQKAVSDLQTLASVVAFVSLCVLGIAIWAAYNSASPQYEGVSWGYQEALATAAFWVFTLPATVALVYITLNALRSRRRIADLETVARSSSHAVDGDVQGRAGVASAQLGLVCTTSDPSSVGASLKNPEHPALVLSVDVGPSAPFEKVETTSPHVPLAALSSSALSSPTSIDSSTSRMSLRRMSSFLPVVATVEQVVVTDDGDDDAGGEMWRGAQGEPSGP